MLRLLTPLLLLAIASGVRAQKTFSSTDPAYKENVEAGEAALGEEKYQECLDFYATAFKIKQTSLLSTLRAAKRKALKKED